MSYEELSHQFKLEGKQHFWKYTQIRDCVKLQIGNYSENYILESLNVPQERCMASQFYKLTNYSVSGESSNVKLLQRDLRINFTKEK